MVNLIGNSTPDPNGNMTIFGGTSLLPTPYGGQHWLDTSDQDGTTAYSADTLENSMIAHIASLPADVRSAPTAVIWMHNEGDADWAGQDTDTWENAVRYDASLVRGALGQSAATVPYLFTDVIPFDSDNAASMQAIKAGMENLAADPAFNGIIGTRTGDLDMDNPNNGLAPGTVIYGGPHIDPLDVRVLAGRISRVVIDEFTRYALPGSPLALAGGRLDDLGPQAVAARTVPGNPYQLVVDTLLDPASTNLTQLTSGAAAGLGWSIQTGGAAREAKSAALLAGNSLLLTFASPVSSGPGATLNYGYGTSRIAAGAETHTGAGYPGTGVGSPGEGNSVYDDEGMPIWTASSGIAITQKPPEVISAPGDRADYRVGLETGGAFVIQGILPGEPTEYVDDTSMLQFSDGLQAYEATGLTADLSRAYQAGLGRAPDHGSLSTFLALHLSLGDFASYVPVSPEFGLRYGDLDNSSFVTRMYENALGRLPEAPALSADTALLNNGSVSRGQLLLSIAESTEARVGLNSSYGDPFVAQVERSYQAELGRAPSAADLYAGVGSLAGGEPASSLADGIAAFPEFAVLHSAQSDADFVKSIYASALGRPEVGAEDRGWTDALAAGQTRAQVSFAIGNSEEAVFSNSRWTHEGLANVI